MRVSGKNFRETLTRCRRAIAELEIYLRSIFLQRLAFSPSAEIPGVKGLLPSESEFVSKANLKNSQALTQKSLPISDDRRIKLLKVLMITDFSILKTFTPRANSMETKVGSLAGEALW